ncbi:MAG: DUF3990 domain-containing protein, partial [Polyangiaceae bacterium]|nr:DUF3990 domain-containing protein [Polyangiaceae bacterium]
GQGFYLTDIREQAVKMARRVVRLHGGSPCVSVFDFNEEAFTSDDIKTLSFDKPDKDWALFVLNNRNKRLKVISDALCNQDNKYDIVSGSVANDDIAYLFRTFTNGLIDINALVRGLEYKSLTTQYSFHTEKSLKYLKPTEDRLWI